MNTLGKTVPSLIDPILLKDMVRMQQIQKAMTKTTTPYQFININADILSFLYKYGIIIVVIIFVIGYIWQRYSWYQSIKGKKQHKNETFINPGQYVCDRDNSARILQRPIPEYKVNDMNKQIRDIYLDKLERKNIRASQSLPVRVSCKRTNYDQDNGRLDNVYGQSIDPYNQPINPYEAPIEYGCPGPLGRNAPLRADVPDCDNFYEFYDTNDNMYN